MKLQDFDFRVWDNESKEYNRDREVLLSSKNVIYRIHTITGELQELINKNLEIELWSGFYDKNNKKIFENDIVKHLDTNLEYLVEFYNASFIMSSLKYQHRREFQLSISIFFSTISKEAANNKFDFLEIIGNIHENKNLLKKNNQ